MENKQSKLVIPRDVDPQAPRTEEYSLGVDDIGLPEDIVPEGARKPGEITPDPEQMTRGQKPAGNRS